MQRLGLSVAACRTVSRHSRDAYLDANMAKSLGDDLSGALQKLRNVPARRVGIAIHGFPLFSSGQLVDGHAGLAAFDVPQSLVHAADGVIQDRTVAPVGAVVHGLPKVVDAIRRFADEKRAEVFFDGGIYQFRALREGAAPITVKAVLIGDDLDDGQ